MVDKPSPSSERRPKQPRKSPSDCSATSARERDVSSSAEPSLSSSWKSRKSERKRQAEPTPSSDDHSAYLNHLFLRNPIITLAILLYTKYIQASSETQKSMNIRIITSITLRAAMSFADDFS